jgi:hypothetical protein
LVYCKNGLTLRKTERYKENKFNQFIEFELVAKRPLHFTVIYRPPNSGAENIAELCKIIENAARDSIILGDFNLPEIDWVDEQSGGRGRPVLEAVINNQMVDFATHTKGNMLDLVVTNCSDRGRQIGP